MSLVWIPVLCLLTTMFFSAAEMAFIELLGAEQELNEKAQKRAEARTKKREELAKQMEERGEGEASDPNAEA